MFSHKVSSCCGFGSALLIGLITVFSAAISHGAVVVISQDMTLSDFLNAGNDHHFADAPKVAVSNGDDITVSFNFSNGELLRLSNPSASSTSYATGWPWLEAWGDSGKFTISNISVSLTAATVTGEGNTSLWEASETDGTVHLGPLAYLSLGGYSSLTFAGITASYHVDAVPGGTNFYQPWIHGYFDGLDASIVSGKKKEPRGSEVQICYDASSDTMKGPSEKVYEAPTNEKFATAVPDATSTAGLLFLTGVLLVFVPKRLFRRS
ncbi:MAG: hypothetical protein JWM32_554 [Verrucomicrobia bacterium]|nr:hypothetical protein [Verrucomicrobiota bacterium]